MEAELVRREKNAAEPDMNYKTPFTKEEHMEQRRQQETDKRYLEEVVPFIRLHLYNRGVPCGAQVIQRQLQELHIKPLPSVRTIGRILSHHGLTYGRTGIYVEDCICGSTNQGQIQNNNVVKQPKKRLDNHQNMK